MKKLLSRFFTAFLCFFVMTSFISGQNATQFNLERQIFLTGESENLEIILSISEQDKSLNLKIQSNIEEGGLTIEIYNPKNEQQGNYSIGAQLKSAQLNRNKDPIVNGLVVKGYKKETVQGTITRSIKNPVKGNWVVKIIPKKAKGRVTIVSESDQLSYTGINK